jgi:hypothetical protein
MMPMIYVVDEFDFHPLFPWPEKYKPDDRPAEGWISLTMSSLSSKEARDLLEAEKRAGTEIRSGIRSYKALRAICGDLDMQFARRRNGERIVLDKGSGLLLARFDPPLPVTPTKSIFWYSVTVDDESRH